MQSRIIALSAKFVQTLIWYTVEYHRMDMRIRHAKIFIDRDIRGEGHRRDLDEFAAESGVSSLRVVKHEIDPNQDDSKARKSESPHHYEFVILEIIKDV